VEDCDLVPCLEALKIWNTEHDYTHKCSLYYRIILNIVIYFVNPSVSMFAVILKTISSQKSQEKFLH